MNISGENIRKSLVKVFEFGKSIHVFLLQEAPEEQKEPEKSEKAKDMVHLAFSKNHRLETTHIRDFHTAEICCSSIHQDMSGMPGLSAADKRVRASGWSLGWMDRAPSTAAQEAPFSKGLA